MTLTEMQNLDEEKLIAEFANNPNNGDKLAKFKEAMNKIDVSKLFKDSPMTDLSALKEKYFGSLEKYNEKMAELDKALAVVTEQLEKNPEEARKILNKELTKAKKMKKSIESTLSTLPDGNVDLTTILSKMKR